MGILPLIGAAEGWILYTTSDRFRRALIGHYITGNAEQVTAFMQPILRMDGSMVTLDVSEPGGPCGV